MVAVNRKCILQLSNRLLKKLAVLEMWIMLEQNFKDEDHVKIEESKVKLHQVMKWQRTLLQAPTRKGILLSIKKPKIVTLYCIKASVKISLINKFR